MPLAVNEAIMLETLYRSLITEEKAEKAYEEARKTREEAKKAYEEAKKAHEKAEKAYEETKIIRKLLEELKSILIQKENRGPGSS